MENNNFIEQNCNIFAKEAFTKREAWNWLFNNMREEESQSNIKASLRILAQEWQWPKTKVARFLKDLTSTKLIAIENHSSYSLIKLIKNNNQKIILLDPSSITQSQPLDTDTGTEIEPVNDTAQALKSQDIEEISGTANGTLNGTENQEIALSGEKTNQLGQKRDNSGTANGIAKSKVEYDLQTISGTANGTIAGQYRDSNGFAETEKEEKKKRSKKRKEENTKEKYSLKGIQKERYEDFENDPILLATPSLTADSKANEKGLSKKTREPLKRKTFEQVEVSDVSAWIETSLPTHINPEWELAKFQDYYRANSRKLPRDGIAAFRNWLRKASEFKSINNLQAGENLNGRHNNYQNGSYGFKHAYGSRFKGETGFERFLAGGIRAVS